MTHTTDDNAFPDNKQEQVISIFIRILFGNLIVSPGCFSLSYSKTLRKLDILFLFKDSTSNSTSTVQRHLGDVMKTLGRQLVHRWEDFLDQTMQVALESQSRMQTLANDTNPLCIFLAAEEGPSLNLTSSQ
ncbi:uncharacterized protein VP01_5349g1 [Puccinia sorghi]|uniref:Uncharacterized protein n=1 Tax=Puccinia sorghi TaxID=27349 RepID=A0A0L6UM37_9BASI|nr:uncharacterized protein VP01_5349g1 [Puccinia sorghi]